MSAFVKDFDHTLAFISEASQRCGPQPAKDMPVNSRLSRLVTYMYMVSKHLSIDTAVVVPEPYYDLLKSMFGNHSMLVKDRPDTDGATIMMNVVSYDSLLKHGETLMPVFVPTSSTQLHNIYESNAEAFPVDSSEGVKRHINGCMNFFNSVVRSKSGCVSDIIWKDPIAHDTKLQKYTYDQMFALYACDMYLKRAHVAYSSLSGHEKLAIALSCLDLLEEESKKITVRTAPVEQRKIESHAVVATPAWPLSDFVVPNTEDDPDLKEDDSLHYYSSVLAFLSLKGVKKTSSVVVHIHGDYPTYNFVKTLSEVFSRATFHVYTGSKVTLHPSPRVKNIVGQLSIEPGQHTSEFIVSTARVDAKIPGFSGGFVMVLLKNTIYEPTNLIMPLYSKSTDRMFCIINGGTREKMEDSVGSLRLAQKKCESFNITYRDRRLFKYLYTSKDVQKTRGLRTAVTSLPGSYDDSYTRLVVEKL